MKPLNLVISKSLLFIREQNYTTSMSCGVNSMINYGFFGLNWFEFEKIFPKNELFLNGFYFGHVYFLQIILITGMLAGMGHIMHPI